MLARLRWMRLDRTTLIGLMTAAVLILSGCARTISQLTTRPASWSYVQSAWGGVVLGETGVTDGALFLQLSLPGSGSNRVDSGVCSEAGPARLEGGRILVHLNRRVCDPHAAHSSTIRLAKPPAGLYQVFYDDAAANEPHLGQVRVE
jgi:hypothetical protein